MRPALAIPGAALGGLVCLSVLASACGGPSGSATRATTSGAGSPGGSKRDALVAFSTCMRSHGVPKFPDPESLSRGMRLSLGSESGIDTNAPKFKRAEETCRNLLPNGGRPTPQEQRKRLQQALGYAACMRKHGVPKVPDPRAAAGGGIDWGAFGRFGPDPNSPEFKSAHEACDKLLPGAAGPGQSGTRESTP